MGYVEQAYWIDVGTPEALRRASCDLVLGVAFSPVAPRPAADCWTAEGAGIAADAVLTGGTSVGPDARIGAAANVRGCLVDVAATVGPGARLVDCVVAAGAEVAPGAELRGAVVDAGD
jgi:mannose-1-phosphate guanylyltransferase